MSRVVVVGVDGSTSSSTALSWAMRQAAENGWTVEAVVVWPEPEAAFVHEVPGHYCDPRGRAVAALETAVKVASAGLTSVPPVLLRVENGDPVDVLLTRSVDARLLVLGSGSGVPPPPGGPRHSVVGKTCEVLATCPVVVVESPVTTR